MSDPSGRRFEVVVSDLAAQQAATFGWQRLGDGTPSEGDLWSGPMLSAVLQLREFDSCREVPGFDGVIREVWVLDPVFGPVVFTAVLVGEIVEIASFRTDPDYWDTVNSDP